MDELLQELVKNELLSEETQKQLKEAFTNKINEAIELAKTEAANNTRVELIEKWHVERNSLIEALDKKIDESLKNEIDELKESISNFRDLEVEYAQKIIEHKAAMAEELKNDMSEILENLDSFLEIRIKKEIEELKESIEEAKKLNFGKKIFEAFAEEFDLTFTDEDSIKSELNAVKEKLANTEKSLSEAINDNETVKRKLKMNELLSVLGNKQREVMETILDKVATNKLDEMYSLFLPKILKESANTTEKETKVLAESEKGIVAENVSVITGDKKPLNVNEEATTSTTTKSRLSESAKEMLKKLSGIE